MTTRLETPILYCDIDGTIRWGKSELGRFVNTADDVHVFDEVPALLQGYKNLGWRICGISNQGGIALGHMTMEDCFAAMGETQRQCNGLFDKIVFCAHSPYDDCPCRKPKPGLVYHCHDWLAEHHPESMYPMPLGLFVGDRPEDEACAANAGLRFFDAESWRMGIHLETLKNS